MQASKASIALTEARQATDAAHVRRSSALGVMVHAAGPGSFWDIGRYDAPPLLAGLDVALYKGPGLRGICRWRLLALMIGMLLLCSLGGMPAPVCVLK